MKKILKYVLLILFFSLIILFFNQPLVEASEPASTVSINGETLDNEYKYLVDGVKAKNGTLGSDGCTVQFDSNTGVLILNGYSGGGIQTGQGQDLTIKLIGDNKITENNNSQAWGISKENDGALTITSDSEANLTINVRSEESMVAGIKSDYLDNYSNDSIIIGGKANIIVKGNAKRSRADGIYANTRLSIIDNASFSATLSGYYNNKMLQCGIEITKPLLINTTGNIDLDASYDYAFNWPCNGYGIYSTSTMTLHNVGTMTIKYPTKNGGDAWNAAWTIPENFAVNEGNVNGIKTKEIHSGSGIVHTLTFESAVNMFGKTTGQYFKGDVIKISGTSEVIGLKFRNWVPSAGLVENSLLENTNYTMPDSDATVTANYTPFASQPQFTKINSTSGKIDYTLNGEFIESGRRLVKAEETAEDEFSCNHEFLSTPYEINEGTENNQVPAGKYKIAVKHESKWYYSDTFTVNYGKQTIDDDKENNTDDNTEDNTGEKENKVDNNTDNNKENNASNNDTENNIENNSENITKLPQTGEETNGVVEWLSRVILLGIFWLVSMLLIDREKKKMAKK